METRLFAGNSGHIFPTGHSWKESGKVEKFFLRGKGERLWSGKGKFVENFVENRAACCRTLHRLWKAYSTILHSGFHSTDFSMLQMNCCERTFFAPRVFHTLLKLMWKTGAILLISCWKGHPAHGNAPENRMGSCPPGTPPALH